jgi:hypothetical protein
MSTLTAFAPNNNNTVAVTPTAASSQIALPTPIGNTGGQQLRVVNRTTQDVFLAFGTGGAAPVAVVPTPGSPANGLIVLAGEDAVFTPPAGTTNVACIQAVAGTGNLYYTVGEGM